MTNAENIALLREVPACVACTRVSFAHGLRAVNNVRECPTCALALYRAIARAAVEGEREACAALAVAIGREFGNRLSGIEMAEHIAAAIRARGEPG